MFHYGWSGCKNTEVSSCQAPAKGKQIPRFCPPRRLSVLLTRLPSKPLAFRKPLIPVSSFISSVKTFLFSEASSSVPLREIRVRAWQFFSV